MTFYKKISRDINVNGKKRKDLPLNAEIFSYDEQVSKFVLTLNSDIDDIDLSGAKVLAMMEYIVNGEKGSVEALSGIESAADSSIYFIVPSKLRGFEGSVTTGVYIELTSGEKIDIQNLKFKMTKSLIDSTSGPAAEIYFESFNDVLVKVQKAGETAVDAVNTEAKKVSDHADQKIKEYDSKFTQSNQKMSELQQSQTNLSNQLTETQQKITDADVFTKAESSANVIDQIGGAESAILKKELIVDGSEGTAARDENGTLAPFSQVDYDDLNNLEKVVRSEILVSGAGAGIQFVFPLIETLERRYPYIFKDLTTLNEKVEKLIEYAKSASLVQTFRGRGINPVTNELFSYARAMVMRSGSWASLGGANYSTEMKSTTYSVLNASYIGDDGSLTMKLTTVLTDGAGNAALSDGSTPAWIEIKDIKLIVEFEFSANEIIKLEIAANHVENLATQEEAELAEDNTKTMTPLRTSQQIDKKAVTIAGNQTVGGIKNFKDELMLNGENVLTETVADTTYQKKTVGMSLWAGTTTLDSDKTITPSKKLSECSAGWLLIFAPYSGSTAQNYDVTTVFVPKGQYRLTVCQVFNGSAWIQKRYQCTDSVITGHSSNVGTEQIKAALIEVREV